MYNLENKLKLELTEESCIVACRFPLPNWKPIKCYGEGLDTVWIYNKECSV